MEIEVSSKYVLTAFDFFESVGASIICIQYIFFEASIKLILPKRHLLFSQQPFLYTQNILWAETRLAHRASEIGGDFVETSLVNSW